MNSKKKMMIVDDKRVNRFTLSTIFEDSFDIIECINGAEAIATLKNNEIIDIMLLDLVMPECDGFDVLNFIREEKMDKIPVILITASADDEQIRRGFELKIDDFIHKPFDEGVVRQRVSQVLDAYANNR